MLQQKTKMRGFYSRVLEQDDERTEGQSAITRTVRRMRKPGSCMVA
jgi:hypothetical protein